MLHNILNFNPFLNLCYNNLMRKCLLTILVLFTLMLPVLAFLPFDYRLPKKPRAYVWHPHNESSYQLRIVQLLEE